MNKSKKWQYREIEKSLGWKISELLQSLQVVRDALYGLRAGRNYQLIPLTGQLRALLTDRDKKYGNEPLLLKLAKVMQEELRLYAMPDAEKSEIPLKDDLLIHISGFPVSLQQELPAQQQMTIKEFLGQRNAFIKGKYWSVEEIIDLFANKAGGVHFSPKAPKDFAELMPFLVSPMSQIGAITFESGRELIKRLSDFEIHFLLAVRNLPDDKVYLFDAKYLGTESMRFSLLIDSLGRLEAHITDLQGQSVALATSQLLDWSDVRHVKFCLINTEDFLTELEIIFDGSVVATLRTPVPLFVYSNILDYEVFINRAFDGDAQQYEFGLAEMVMIGAEDNLTTHARLEVYFDDKRQKEDLKCCVYTPGSFSKAPKGTNDQQMYGLVRRSNVKSFLQKQ